jgi:hypothetical protein
LVKDKAVAMFKVLAESVEEYFRFDPARRPIDPA